MRFKKLTAGIMAAVMMLTAVATPLGDNLPAVRDSVSMTASAASWPSDYRYWSQAASDNSMMRSYGCWVVAQAKLLQEIGAAPSGFNPDSYLSWEKSNGYINSNFNQVNGVNAPCKYAQQQGKSLSYLGATSSNITSKIWDNINNGYYSIIYVRTSAGSSHYVMIGNELSKSNNAIWVYNSNTAQSSAKPTSLSSKNYTLKEVYTYKSGSSVPVTDNVKLTGTSYKIANTVSDTNAFVVTDVYKPSNYKLTKAGIRIRRYDGSYDNGWSEFHNTASTWTGYDYMRISYDMNSEVKITLRHGTKYYYKFYAVIEGKEYWSPEQSFTTTGSHSYGSWYTTTSATCTSGGTEERKCSCGAVETRSTSALGHDYGYWETDRDATCTEDGTEARICSRCGGAEYRTTSALGHDFSSEWTIDVQPTCTAEGSKSRHCTRCDEKTDITTIEKTDHSYNAEIVQPTFEEQGYTIYTCTECGYSYYDDYTAKLTKPNPVSGLTYYNRSADTISVKWGKVSNADGYILEWLNGNKFEKAASFTANSDLKYTFKNLSPATMYKFRVRCYKVSGGTRYYSDYSTVLNVKTYPQKISKVKQTAATESSVTVCWDKTESARGYVIEKLNGDTWERVITLKDGSVNTYTVTGLNPSTEYQFRIKRYVTEGEKMLFGAYSDVYTATTAPKAPANFALSARSSTYLTLKWGKNANADGYIVEMYKDGNWSRIAKITDCNTTTYKASGLKAGTAYKFRVKAYKMNGSVALYSDYSATVAARTNPSVIKGAKLGGRAADALRINWTKNTSADGYIVEMYQGNKWVRVAKITSNSTTTFRKAGLKASTVYKFRVRAYKMSGSTALYGNYSATVTARTNPSIMKGVKIGGTAKDALRVNWTKNTSAQGYIVEMYKGGKWVRVAKITNGNTTTYRKAGLAKNTTYKFRVKAYYMSGKTALYGNYGSVSGKTAAK